MKSFFKTIKNEVKKEINKQIDQATGGGGSRDPSDPNRPHTKTMDTSLVEGVLGLLSGGGGAGGGGGGGGGLGNLQQILGAIQGAGGILPGSVAKYLPGILKIAEMIGHGMGDDTPRTQQNPDGSFVDDFVKTLVDGRKIHAGGGSKSVKELTQASLLFFQLFIFN